MLAAISLQFQSPRAILNASSSNVLMTGGGAGVGLISGPSPKIGPGWLIPGIRCLIFLGVASGSCARPSEDAMLGAFVLAGAAAAAGVVTVIAGDVPQRPKTQPPTFEPKDGRLPCRWSAAMPLNKLRLLSVGREIAAEPCAWLMMDCEVNDRPPYGVRSCEGLDLRVWMSMAETDKMDSCEAALRRLGL